jgi:hypothetical protein
VKTGQAKSEKDHHLRVKNEPGESGGGTGPFAELLRLQTDFQARLAEETLRYLRRLQGTMGPAAPGTIVLPEDGLVLTSQGAPGGRATLRVEIENLQRVHCMVTPQLTPLVGRAGVTWFPAIEPNSLSFLLPPDAVHSLVIDVAVPTDLPPDVYTGALLLQGFQRGALSVAIDIAAGIAERRGDSTPGTRPDPGTVRRGSPRRPADVGVNDAPRTRGPQGGRKTGPVAAAAPEPPRDEPRPARKAATNSRRSRGTRGTRRKPDGPK